MAAPVIAIRPDSPWEQIQHYYARQLEATYPGVEIAHGVTFEEIWKLFLESGFLYPEKIARLEPVLPEIQQTVRKLLAANGRLMVTAVLREHGLLGAHMSKLRWQDKTWMLQHLAAVPLSARDLDASARLTLGFAYYGRLRPDIHWIKMFFRTNNAWPARLFGGFGRHIAPEGAGRTCDLRVFHYLVADTGHAGTSVTDIGPRVRPACSADLALVEQWFTSRGREPEMLANAYSAGDRDGVARIEQEYANAGLERRREILVVEKRGRVAGFATLEISSLGMNFSELTNAFTVHLLEEDPQLRLALIGAAKQRYRDLGRLQCVALEEKDDLTAFTAHGFHHAKDYACLTLHRSHFGQMEEYFVDTFSTRRRTK